MANASKAVRSVRFPSCSRFWRTSIVVGVLSVGSVRLWAQDHLEIKYVRDSEEYWTLTQQVYRSARDVVVKAKDAVPRGTTWGVVMDVDETSLDNSLYQLDRAAYRVPFDSGSWNAWVRREQAPPVPGAVDF